MQVLWLLNRINSVSQHVLIENFVYFIFFREVIIVNIIKYTLCAFVFYKTCQKLTSGRTLYFFIKENSVNSKHIKSFVLNFVTKSHLGIRFIPRSGYRVTANIIT